MVSEKCSLESLTLHSASHEMATRSDISGVLESLLSGALKASSADGATVYLLDEHQMLHFFVIQNISLNLSSEKDPKILDRLNSIPLYDTCGPINKDSLAAAAVVRKESIYVRDIYDSTEFHFQGEKNFDKLMNYRTKSVVAIPMQGSKREVIGVLQLVNHIVEDEISDFTSTDICMAEILANQAAIHIDNHNMQIETSRLMHRISRINQIGIALTSEHKIEHLLELILDRAKELTGADGGSLYLYKKGKLEFEVMRTQSLNIHLSREEGNITNIKPIEVYDREGKPNDHIVASHVAAYAKPINIPNVYEDHRYNFTRVKSFDQENGYCTKSMLTVPLINQQDELVGVLQLINAMDEITQEVCPFSDIAQELAESLASFAAVAITNNRLNKELEQLIESFIQVISKAIDEKSAYTGGHCRRVPDIALRLIKAISDHDSGEFANFKLTEESLYEMKIASMLHDCGKITTPIHIVDKATKLERICDRIDQISLRYEILRRDELIQYLREQSDVSDEMIKEAIHHVWDTMVTDLEFLRTCNIGGEYMAPRKQERIREIAKSHSWTDAENVEHPLLSDNEIYNLSIAKGTLNNEDREIINYHITATINMLEALPFPGHLKNVAEIAGGHHERMDGKGYPRGLTKDQMSIQARAMGIADIFEALTACDRPYKKAMPLSRVMSIMESMKDEGHIDPELFEIFKNHRIHIEYARDFLDSDQMDL